MGWLSPWILAGALLAAVPWWLHRRRRPAARATPFGSLMFVPAGPEPTRRRRVRHRRLLALRLAALLLLTTAFARPYRLLEEGALQDAEAGLHVVAVDVSASMGVGGRLDRAREEAAALLDSLPAGDRAVVLAYGRRPQALGAWGSPAEAAAALALLKTGWQGTDHAAALQEAERLLAGAGPGRRLIHLVGDLQESGMPPVEAVWRLPDTVRLRVHAIEGGLRAVPTVERVAVRQTATGAVEARVRLKNDAAVSQAFSVRLVVGDSSWNKEAEILPHSARQLVFAAVGDGRRALSGYVETEAADFAGRRYFAWNPPRVRSVRVVGAALQPVLPPALSALDTGQRWQVEADDAATEGETEPDLVVAVGASSANRSLEGEWLLGYLNRGGRLLLTLPAEPVPSLEEFLAAAGVLRRETVVAELGAVWEWVDFGHALFAPFRSPQFNDFTAMRLLRYPRLQVGAPAKVLARLGAEGDPALIESQVGPGRVLVWAGGLEPSESNLARSPRFAALVRAGMEYLCPPSPPLAAWSVGDRVPAGRVGWLAGPAEGPVATAAFTEPGLVEWSGGIRAVNVPAAESDPASVGAAELLLRLGGGTERRPAVAAEPSETRREYGLPLIGLALLALAGESALAVYCGRREGRDENA